MSTAEPVSKEHKLQSRLTELLGAENVVTSAEERAFYSSDIFGGNCTAALVVRPETREQLGASLAAITDAGFSVVGRGGGASYTGGYVPDRENSVVIDTTSLNRIIEINAEDMYVTVESGVTWQVLYEALKELGLRTPFWGPLSGSVATVGGSVSQNSILWGATGHGSSGASVLSLEVVTADGTVINTGSAATGSKPFYREYGPDLTGLFLGDCGALGIKASVTLRLIKTPEERRFASFNFDNRSAFASAMASIGREGLAATCFGMDPLLQYQRIKRASMATGVKALKGVMASGKSTFSGIRSAMKIAVAGKRFLDDSGYSLHVFIESDNAGDADDRMARARKICLADGKETENSIPTMMYANPYVEMTSAAGPEGERWAPMHGLFPLSDGDAAWARIEALMEEYADQFDRLGIMPAYLLALVSNTVFVVEPVLYWPAPRTGWHERMLEPAQLAKYKDFPENPEVTAVVMEARGRLNELFAELGAAHLQIGKKYLWSQNLEPGAKALISALKSTVDPRGLMNPGALGLN